MQIAADGELTLIEAIEQAEDGATLELGPGDHYLRAACVIRRGVRLVGGGAQHCRLVVAQGCEGLIFTGEGSWALSGLSVLYRSPRFGHALRVEGGELELRDCRIEGGHGRSPLSILEVAWRRRQAGVELLLELLREGGCGLLALGGARVRVEGGLFAQADSLGVGCMGSAHLHMEGTAVERIHFSGVMLFEESTGTLKGCRVQRTVAACIYAGSRQAVSLVDNECAYSERGPCISLIGPGEAQLSGNDCHHGSHGIEVQTERAVLQGNRCHDNRVHGIALNTRFQGEVRDNTCTHNGCGGIAAWESAAPRVEGNRCGQNQQAGLLFMDSAQGVAQGNVCEGNRVCGIQVLEQSRPQLLHNRSTGSPVGLHIQFPAQPQLGENVLEAPRPLVRSGLLRHALTRVWLWALLATVLGAALIARSVQGDSPSLPGLGLGSLLLVGGVHLGWRLWRGKPMRRVG